MTVSHWVQGARPPTLPAAVVPVVTGTAVAAGDGGAVWWRAGLALLVAIALQIGVNYANDYSDGVRGTDAARVGPARLVASGLAAPRAILHAAVTCFALAAAAGLALAAVTTWWLLVVGALAIAAAWFYTGGNRPYGYRALGEVSVFCFFGLVAVIGTVYVQTERIPWLAFAVAVPIGVLICALLVVNNLRDIPGDADAGKRTLAVVLGEARTRWLYACCVAAPMLAVLALTPVRPAVFVALLSSPAAVGPLRRVLGGQTGADLVPALRGTGRLLVAYGVLLSVGLVL